MTIRWRADRQCYEAQWRDTRTGKRCRVLAPTKQQTQARYNAWVQQQTNHDTGGARASHVTVKQFAEAWLRNLEEEDLSLRTKRCYQQNIRMRIIPLLGAYTFSALTVGVVHNFLQHISRQVIQPEQKTLSKDSVRLARATLSKLLGDAILSDLISWNPVKQLPRRRHQTQTDEAHPMNETERIRFLDTITQLEQDHQLTTPYAMLYPLLMKTGLRPSEALALTVTDLDLQQQQICVNKAMDLEGRVKSTKTRTHRLVDLSTQLTQDLDTYMTWIHAEAIRTGTVSPIWLFPRPDGQPLADRQVRKIFQRIVCKAGLAGFRTYDLRHTYASTLLSRGVPLLYVAQQLGHTKPSTTLKYYARWLPTKGERYPNLLDHQHTSTVGSDQSATILPPLLGELPIALRGDAANVSPQLLDRLEVIDGGSYRDRTCGPLIKSHRTLTTSFPLSCVSA